MNATSDVALSGPEAKVLDAFIQVVSNIDNVQQVLVEPTVEGICIWAIIDAEPLAFAPRKPAYDAELQAADVAPQAHVDFRLINQREYPGDRLHQVLPVNGRIAWRRAT